MVKNFKKNATKQTINNRQNEKNLQKKSLNRVFR